MSEKADRRRRRGGERYCMRESLTWIGDADSKAEADRVLRASAATWFVTAAIGMWAFVFYITAYYLLPALRGGLEAWDDSFLPNGYVEGDPLGNFVVAIHLFLAVVVIGGGTLQLAPQIRNRFPAFHRGLGRTYLGCAVLVSLSGLYMVWVRKDIVGDLAMHFAVSLNAVLVLAFAALVLRYARARRIDVHRRWALRLFLAANGPWFLRIGYQFYNCLRNGSIRFDTTVFSTDIFVYLNFAQYLVPLAILELYFLAQTHAGTNGKLAMAAVLLVATSLTATGVFAATFGMWFPQVIG